MKKSILLLLTFLLSFVAYADNDIYTMEGKIGNSPIELTFCIDYDSGQLSGRYGYKSTLQKQGRKKSSYRYYVCLNGAPASEVGNATGFTYRTIQVVDHKQNVVETWTNVNLILGRGGEISGKVQTNTGKTLKLTAYY